MESNMETLLEGLLIRTEKQRNRLDFLKKELQRPEVLAVAPVAEAYGREMLSIQNYLTQEADATGLAIDELMYGVGDEEQCRVTYH